MPIWMRQATRIAGTSWRSVGIVLIVFGGAELALFVRDQFRSNIDVRRQADAYQQAGWVDEYFDELNRASHMVWRPYVYWRRTPFHGKYINVRDDGLRTTANPPACQAGSDHTKILMFGGSALWGTGARDAATIPSLVAGALQQRGVAACVTNFGESGYVTSQEVIELLALIRAGSVPDLVIFYDGFNDTFSAIQNRRAGLPQNESHREIEFNLVQSPRRLAVGLMRHSRVVGRLVNIAARFRQTSVSETVPTIPGLADGVSRTYWANVQFVDAIAARYQFKTLWYWQPILLDKSFRSRFESHQEVAAEREVPQAVHRAVLAALERDRPASIVRFRLLAPVVADIRAPLFIDSVHSAESGNALIAERIAQDIAEALSP